MLHHQKNTECLLFIFIYFGYFYLTLTQDNLQTSFTKVPFKSLEGNSTQHILVSSILRCCWKCQRLPECFSLNFSHQPKQNGLYECVLLSSNENQSGRLLKPSDAYHHYIRLQASKLLPAIPDREEAEKSWLKINSCPVCFGAKNSSYGRFDLKQNGTITTVKLVHLFGYVTCNYKHQSASSNWGCGAYVSGANKTFPDKLLTIITNDKNQKILPQDEYIEKPNILAYVLPGEFTSQSPELIFPNFTTPMKVAAGQEYRIWYGQDLLDVFEDKNNGTACADVYMYGWFG
ncbi:uncharacterized protein LOC116300938 [Actinia tenebrosa]|uniref:Uncharacterized protein LOC116300938 n=1 Tax=Actinia tenebrosa TaxID=6105 RepID=A0A6P8IGG5_ACTTE|nr:uncharacterized protein LOC116300938 [Actinia tenebrosa]